MADEFNSLVEMLAVSVKTYGDRPALGEKRSEGWTWISFAELGARIAALRSALAKLGVGAGDRVAIISNNRVEWAVLAHATYGRRGWFVPMYEVQPAEEWAFILKDCGAKVVVAATKDIYGKLQEIRKQIPTIEHVMGLDLPKDDPASYAAHLAYGREHAVDAQSPDPSEIAGLLYTSGTTGEPKGVMLTHGNIVSNIHAVRRIFAFGPDDRSLSFLNWSHSFGQVAELHVLLSRGVSIAINDEIPNLIPNLAVVKPTVLLAVPRIFNRIYDGVNKQMQDKPGLIRALFRAGIAAATKKRAGADVGVLEGMALALADRLIFAKVRGRFGGRLRFVISGSAALSKDVGEFIDALGIEVYEGYGLTETSPVVSVNYPGHRKMGSIGLPLSGVTVTIDQSVSDEGDQGEIVVRGPNVMKGYYNRPDETRAVLSEDGVFKTGDIGRLDADGYLYITGRVKEQYKLETGKYVAPAPLEEQLKLSPYIVNAFIHGANKPFNVALLVIDVDAVKKWAQNNGVTVDDPCKSERVRELIRGELDRHSATFKSFERPKGFVLIAEDFTPENDLLTPSLKIKRRKVLARYGKNLDALYGP